MRMQICDCRVTLAGEIESLKVNKFGVSVAEALILQEVHGPGSVHNIHNIRDAKASPVQLKAYLSATYMRRAGDESKRDVANLLFPGLAPQFPATFEEAGMTLGAVSETVVEFNTGITELTGIETDALDAIDNADGEGDGEDDADKDLPTVNTPTVDPVKRGKQKLAAIVAEAGGEGASGENKE